MNSMEPCTSSDGTEVPASCKKLDSETPNNTTCMPVLNSSTQNRKRHYGIDSPQCSADSQTIADASPLPNPIRVDGTTNKDSNISFESYDSPERNYQVKLESTICAAYTSTKVGSQLPQANVSKTYTQLGTFNRCPGTPAASSSIPRKKRSLKEIPNQSRLCDYFKTLPVNSTEVGNKDGKNESNVSSPKQPQHRWHNLASSSASCYSRPSTTERNSPKRKNSNTNVSLEYKTKPTSTKASLHQRFLINTLPEQMPPGSVTGFLTDDLDCVGLDAKINSTVLEPSLCKSSQYSNSSSLPAENIFEDFENDMTFDCPEVLQIVEKAESVTSSPCKSSQGVAPVNDGINVFNNEEHDVDLSKLPKEVMETIFCFLPMIDLCQSIALVCKTWNMIISRKKFLYWKKRYYQYKLRVDTTCAELDVLINKHHMADVGSFLLHLIEYLQDFRNWNGLPMLEGLKKHRNFELAKDLIKERAPHLIKEGTVNPWCVIGALAVVSETVADVSLIIHCLLTPVTKCTVMDVLECHYCIATLMLMLQRIHNTNRGVFYALYLYENSFSDISTKPLLAVEQHSASPQSPLRYQHMNDGVRLTPEQVRIIAYEPKYTEVVKIVAFAGTGKTTTLIKFAERRPNIKFLYVAFNRAVKEHAATVFPANVTAKTTHSMAFGQVGVHYKNRFTSSLSPKYVHDLLPPNKKKTKLHWITRAKLVINTLKTFMSSLEDFITTLHVPSSMICSNQGGMRTEISHNVQLILADDASYVWEKLIDVKNNSARITHDVYLKLYQLSKPEIVMYDCILIDEAQDLTAVQQDILLRQKCTKILVGDPNQQIYSFRGAQNAMDEVQRYVGPDIIIQTFHLTQSFRFGPEIAYVANLILEFFKGNTTLNIVGKEKPGSIHGEEVGAVAIICRSNMEIFDQAVRICDEARSKHLRTRIGFAGGIQGYGFSVLQDIYQLSLPDTQKTGIIQNKFVQSFKSFSEMKIYAMHAMDGELEGKIKIVQKYNQRIPSIIADITARETHVKYADIILTTVHKSKGLEFDTVKLAEDFTVIQYFLLAANHRNERILPDELNMVYVAITRAKKRLVLNYSLLKFLEYAHECFECPVSTKIALAKHDAVPKCLDCDQLIKPGNAMLMRRPKLTLCFCPESNVPPNNGYICGRCSSEKCKWFKDLCGPRSNEGNMQP